MKFSRLYCLVALAATTACGTSYAQQAPAAPAAAAAHISPGRQKLIDQVLELWHIEDTAIRMVQRPAAGAMEQASIALQGRVTQAKREATLKDISTDVQKYIDEATPIARNTALRLKEPVLAPLLAQNFSDDELRQLIVLLQSPVKKKFEQLLPEFDKTFGERVAAESHTQIDPKLKTLTEAVGTKLRAAAMTP
jgi:hypothetical protein